VFWSRRAKRSEIRPRQASPEQALAAAADASLPDRPSLQGYRIGVLSPDEAARFFRSYPARRRSR